MLHVAVLEPDRYWADLLMRCLEQAGHSYTCCSQEKELIACLQRQPFDLLLLDCGCADQKCSEFMQACLASQAERVPLLYLANTQNEADIIRALEYGADDYITKPFQTEMLLARMQVLVARFEKQAQYPLSEIQCFGLYRIDRKQRQLYRRDKMMVLTDKDFNLADYLFTHQHQLLSRERLLAEVWGVSQQVNTRTVDMHISRLRKALSLEGSGYEIQTVPQRGYRLQRLE